MKLAWFAPAADDVALELGRSHRVHLFDERRAHEFVWQHFREPYDLTIFELGDTPTHAFVWPYVFHYPGVVVLRSASLQHSRTGTLLLADRRRDLLTERLFSGWNFLRAPLAASRLVVVFDAGLRRELAQELPEIAVRMVPVGVSPAVHSRAADNGRFVIAGSHQDVAARAAVRAREMGAFVRLADIASGLNSCDVVVALEWPPPAAPSTAALRAMAAGIPAIVFETEAVAVWPTLDPQTWRTRGYLPDVTPIAVSIDPRDEEHSLMLAMRRLSGDAALRAALGDAARRWAQEHASVEAASAAWGPVLREAVRREPAAGAADLPPHLLEDGTVRARAILNEFDLRVDFLES